MHWTRPGKINTICGARASNKKERRGVIKMTLDQARKRFLYTPAGKDWLKKKSQGRRMAILRSIKFPRTKKAARLLFFQGHKMQGSHAVITRCYGTERVSETSPLTLDTGNLRGRKAGDAHEYAVCSLAEFSMETEYFQERSWQLYDFRPQARGENCMTTVGGIPVAAHFLIKGRNKSSRNKWSVLI